MKMDEWIYGLKNGWVDACDLDGWCVGGISEWVHVWND
jgi:hypothetical protein